MLKRLDSVSRSKVRKSLMKTLFYMIGAILLLMLVSVYSGFLHDLTYDYEHTTAGLDFSESYDDGNQSYEVEVYWRIKGDVETIYAVKPDGSSTERIDDFGKKFSVDGLQDGESLRIIGVRQDGTEVVLRSYTVGEQSQDQNLPFLL